mgnify:CR=1 FL=1
MFHFAVTAIRVILAPLLVVWIVISNVVAGDAHNTTKPATSLALVVELEEDIYNF